jgi:hypothetical protein
MRIEMTPQKWHHVATLRGCLADQHRRVREEKRMRKLILPGALLFTVASGAAMAQSATPQTGVPLTPQGVPPGANPATGARPGNEIGTGMSMPMGTTASNINPSDSNSTIAPNLPSPDVGDNASAPDYLVAARNALAAGKTGETQQSLEMAQTRLLDRSVPLFQTNTPSANPVVAQISQALQALAAGDRPRCMQLIEAAIPNARMAEQAAN